MEYLTPDMRMQDALVLPYGETHDGRSRIDPAADVRFFRVRVVDHEVRRLFYIFTNEIKLCGFLLVWQ